MKFTTSLTSNDPLADAAQAILEAKFGPQSPANKLAQAKSFVKQYQTSLKDAIADGKDAETIAFWKKRLAGATKELAALTAKNEAVEIVDEAVNGFQTNLAVVRAQENIARIKTMFLPTNILARTVAKDVGAGVKADFEKITKLLNQVEDIWEDIYREGSMAYNASINK
jgi:hypothetical protein